LNKGAELEHNLFGSKYSTGAKSDKCELAQCCREGSGSSARMSRGKAMIEWSRVRTPPMANQLPLGLIIHYNTTIHMEALLN